MLCCAGYWQTMETIVSIISFRQIHLKKYDLCATGIDIDLLSLSGACICDMKSASVSFCFNWACSDVLLSMINVLFSFLQYLHGTG